MRRAHDLAHDPHLYWDDKNKYTKRWKHFSFLFASAALHEMLICLWLILPWETPTILLEESPILIMGDAYDRDGMLWYMERVVVGSKTPFMEGLSSFTETFKNQMTRYLSLPLYRSPYLSMFTGWCALFVGWWWRYSFQNWTPFCTKSRRE